MTKSRHLQRRAGDLAGGVLALLLGDDADEDLAQRRFDAFEAVDVVGVGEGVEDLQEFKPGMGSWLFSIIMTVLIIGLIVMEV